MRTTIRTLAALSLVACSGASRLPAATAPAKDPPAQPAEPLQLSASLREVLIDEMLALDAAMPELRAAVEGGDLEAAARLGDEIAATFILRQKLSRAQHHELHSSVPKGFLHLDHRFHDRAGELAQAAREGELVQVTEHLQALEAACTNCHARFAP